MKQRKGLFLGLLFTIIRIIRSGLGMGEVYTPKVTKIPKTTVLPKKIKTKKKVAMKKIVKKAKPIVRKKKKKSRK